MSELEPTRTCSNPTANDILRRMLDERGVEYEVDDGKTVSVTRWKAYGEWVSFIEYDTSETRFCTDMWRCTPEQAIAATLGVTDARPTQEESSGTCHEIEDEDTGFIVCSECGAVHDESYTACYCWCCGRRIEQ